METKTDSNRPSTIRIIAGSLVLLCTFPIFVYSCFRMYDPIQFLYEKTSFFEHIWGKLLVILVSGTILLILFGNIILNECPHVTKLAKYCQVAPKPCFGTLYAGYKT